MWRVPSTYHTMWHLVGHLNQRRGRSAVHSAQDVAPGITPCIARMLVSLETGTSSVGFAKRISFVLVAWDSRAAATACIPLVAPLGSHFWSGVLVIRLSPLH